MIEGTCTQGQEACCTESLVGWRVVEEAKVGLRGLIRALVGSGESLLATRLQSTRNHLYARDFKTTALRRKLFQTPRYHQFSRLDPGDGFPGSHVLRNPKEFRHH
jgi:hypothetical protein